MKMKIKWAPLSIALALLVTLQSPMSCRLIDNHPSGYLSALGAPSRVEVDPRAGGVNYRVWRLENPKCDVFFEFDKADPVQGIIQFADPSKVKGAEVLNLISKMEGVSKEKMTLEITDQNTKPDGSKEVLTKASGSNRYYLWRFNQKGYLFQLGVIIVPLELTKKV